MKYLVVAYDENIVQTCKNLEEAKEYVGREGEWGNWDIYAVSEVYTAKMSAIKWSKKSV